MALLETSLIWVAYAVAIAIGILPVIVYIYSYQTPRDRAISVTLVSTVALSCLLATLLLLPIDVALVSSTNRSRDGVRKEWATQKRVDNIRFSLTVVYYVLYSVDAVFCLLICPFTYFFYEEYDEVESEEGTQTLGTRVAGALKYTSIFVAVVVILIVAGLFVPVIGKNDGKHKDLSYFKDLLAENRGERTLTFTVGLLMSIGTILYVLYTGPGFALLPVSLIKSAPALSIPNLKSTTASQLEQNRERQRQLEARNEGRQGGIDSKDQRELERLIRDERTLVRRERLAAEASGDGHILMKAWNKTGAVLRPLKLLGGILLLVVGLVVWASMLVTGIDKAMNSVCKAGCGYILGHINIFQPVNWIFVISSKVFPIDYVIFLLLVLQFWAASICGISAVGIRFLWVQIFRIRKGRTSPQALLLATVMLALIVLGLNYSIAMVVAPQYATYGAQTYCDDPDYRNGQPDCSNDRSYIKPCSELAQNPAAREICTPTVISTFINRISFNFPYFVVFNFWAQFAFLGLHLVVAITSLFRTPKLDTAALDADLEEEEEEGLLASTGRRFNASWQDITGRAARNNPAA